AFVVFHADRQVDHPAVTKGGAELAGLGIDRDEFGRAGAGDYALGAFTRQAGLGMEGDTAAGAAMAFGRIIHPLFSAGLGVEREELAEAVAHIERVVDLDRDRVVRRDTTHV